MNNRNLPKELTRIVSQFFIIFTNLIRTVHSSGTRLGTSRNSRSGYFWAVF